MKNKSTRDQEVSSGNVFADLGLKDSEGLLMRAELGHYVLSILKSRGLKKQKDVQDVLDSGQAEVSHLMNARYHRDPTPLDAPPLQTAGRIELP